MDRQEGDWGAVPCYDGDARAARLTECALGPANVSQPIDGLIFHEDGIKIVERAGIEELIRRLDLLADEKRRSRVK